jgi:hypothetical protein
VFFDMNLQEEYQVYGSTGALLLKAGLIGLDWVRTMKKM